VLLARALDQFCDAPDPIATKFGFTFQNGAIAEAGG